ncbi:MAG TPA: acetylxylan esterase [Terriglobia bacterium]|nr:acetylxylan esterase [Terriglobia bacterium]
MRTSLPRAIACVLLLATVTLAQDYERAVRALRPADVKPQEAALLDSLEREARTALDAIKHARTRDEVNRTRPELRRKLEESLGWRRLPWPPDLQVETGKTLQRPGYRIEKLAWHTLPGVRVPAHLYLPEKTDAPAPAILFYVGHWWPDSKTHPDFQAFCINMARFGFVVLTWDPFGQGERGVSSRDHRRVESLLVGVAQQGIAEYETQCALRFLLSRSEVDPKRIGITGASGGGFNTWITSALDDRIAAAVPVVGTSEFYEQIQVTRALDWYRASEHCHFVPGLIRYANNHELLAMVSPKPVMVIAASQDQSFPISGVRRVVEYGKGLYLASGAPEKIGFFEDTATGHGYQQKKREAAYGWFRKWLMAQGDGGPYAEPPTEVFPFDALELRCFPPDRNEPAGPGIVAAVRKIADRTKRSRDISLLAVHRPDVTLSPEVPVQRLRIPAPGGLQIPAFLIRGSGRGVLLALDDRGKEFVLKEGRVVTALKDGWSICGVDPRGIGEMATTQAGWLSAVSLLLGSSFVDRQALDLLTTAALFESRSIALLARGPNAVLAAARALPHLARLDSYALYEGFQSYRDFLNRPKSLDISYQLRKDNSDRFAYDREIPFFYVPWKGLLGPDIPDLMKAAKAHGTWEHVMNGDWETRGP